MAHRLRLRHVTLRVFLFFCGAAFCCLSKAAGQYSPIQGIGQITFRAAGVTVPSDNGVDACSHSAHSGFVQSTNWGMSGPWNYEFVPDGTGETYGITQPETVDCSGQVIYTPVPPNPEPAWTTHGSGMGLFSCTQRLGNGNPIPAEQWTEKGISQPYKIVQGRWGEPGSSFACVCADAAHPYRKPAYWDAQLGYCVKGQRVVIGFFNGVWNTEKQAQDGLAAIKELAGDKHGSTKLRYEKFYNQTGTANGNTAAQDLAEVFIQRSNELDGVLADRWEHYWELLSGQVRREGSLTQRLLAGLRDGATGLSDLIDSLVSSTLAGFIKGLAQLMSSPPTAADTAAQLAKLQGLADEGHDLVLVAHSQGNLFVNVAYDGLRQSRPDTKAGVVHVAPASPTLRGPHVLAEIDEVINGLRNFGGWTVPDINIWLRGRGGDPSGHTLVGTYLDGTRIARSYVRDMITTALEQVAPASP